MPKGFSLSILPWVHVSKYTDKSTWDESFIEQEHLSAAEEAKLSDAEQQALFDKRNSFPQLPLVNYTTQYGMGCFEGMKAFPQKDGSLKIFRPDENGKRMKRSMEGIMMPGYPVENFVNGALEICRRNREIGFSVDYDAEWEKDDFLGGHSIYMRPFSYSEPAIGLSLSQYPWYINVATPVGAYFRPGNHKALVTDKIRAFRGGTGWIKCSANYVVPILTKKAAEKAGYMEAIFLDATEKTYVEEGSSCNIFFYLQNGTLVTPELGDTILPGITRKSILQIAQDFGVKTEERKISIEEAVDQAKEVFVTGTAAGLSHFESISYKDKEYVFNDRKIGDLSKNLLKTLKGIQYGAIDDKHGWMMEV